MQENTTDFFKALPGFVRHSDELRATDIETGIYYRWWRLMRLSQLFWYADKAKVQIEDPEAKHGHLYAGDLSRRNFEIWWRDTGRKVFAEKYRPREVRVIELEKIRNWDLYERSVVVEIPLTISKQKLFSELRGIINKHYTNENDNTRQLNVASYSSATLKLHTKKFSSDAMDNEYFTLLYRIMYPDIKLWVIGDRLKLIKNLIVRTADTRSREPRQISEKKRKLQATAGRCLYKARFSRFHLERGTFPNYEKVDIDAAQPFGEARDEHFKMLTSEDKPSGKGTVSDWQKWVQKEYGSMLKQHIMKINKFEDRYPVNSPEFKETLEQYMRGEVSL